MSDSNKVVVCDACLQASCWQGEFMCEKSRDAGTIEKTRAELAKLGLEHPHYWVNPRYWDKKKPKVADMAKSKLAIQDDRMLIDPAFGTDKPYPSHAAQYREYHGRCAWLYNPWTGKDRHPSDIGSDPTGLAICK